VSVWRRKGTKKGSDAVSIVLGPARCFLVEKSTHLWVILRAVQISGLT